jgi:protein SCO1
MKRKNFFIAISVIIIPVLIYFIGKAGSQKFNSLPFYGEKIVSEQSKDTIFYSIPDFNVVSQTGESVSQKTFDNNIYIANFFFASCKDVCPKMNAKVESVYKKVIEQNYAEVKFISFSVDPAHDSVSVLATYAKKFNADAHKWYFVTGSKDAIAKAGSGFLLPVSMEDTLVDHSENLMLVDKKNHIRGIYDGLDEIEIKRLNEDLKVLLYEYHKSK